MCVTELIGKESLQCLRNESTIMSFTVFLNQWLNDVGVRGNMNSLLKIFTKVIY